MFVPTCCTKPHLLTRGTIPPECPRFRPVSETGALGQGMSAGAGIIINLALIYHPTTARVHRNIPVFISLDIVRASSGLQIMKFAFGLVSTALFLAHLTDLASAADCSNQRINGGATNCAQRVANRMCSELSCGGTFDQKVGDIVHVQAVLSGGACPNNCAAAVSNILSQCIENDWSDGAWDFGGEWYWIYSVTNTDAGSAGC
ncbi:hypothetical protein FB451DRAFT_1246509 [Mycena latifolia]|nr:hypothetical protein FB451DRAFT_1246509 [Mycena latifolia]